MKLFKPFFKQFLLFGHFHAGLQVSKAVHIKEVRRFLIAAVVFLPSLVNLSAAYGSEEAPEFLKSPPMFGVSAFDGPSVLGHGTEKSLMQSVTAEAIRDFRIDSASKLSGSVSSPCVQSNTGCNQRDKLNNGSDYFFEILQDIALALLFSVMFFSKGFLDPYSFEKEHNYN